MIKNTLLWSTFERYIPNLLQITSTLIIARLVNPSEFGEVALVTVFTQIASLLIASGFAEALMFRVKNSNLLLSSVFYSNIFFAIILYLLMFCFSNFIAKFYGIARLDFLLRVIGINIFLYSLTYIHRVLYSLAQDFKTPGLIVFSSTLFGCILGVLLAYNHFGVLSLVYQTLTINFFQVILFWSFSKWRPLFSFSYVELKLILPFSLKILINNLLQTFYDNLYTLIIGKAFSSLILGYFNRIQTILYFTTTNLMYAAESVYYPKLCKQRVEKDFMIEQAYEKIIRVALYFAFPVLIVLFVHGDKIILLLLSDKWLGSLFILKYLSIAFLFVPITYLNNSFLKIENKASLLFYSNVFKKVIGIIVIIISMNFKIEGVLIGIVIYNCFDAFISMLITQRVIGINMIKQIGFMRNVFFLNLCFFLVLYSSDYLVSNFLLRFSVSLISGIFFYLLVPFLFKFKESIILKNMLTKV